VTFKKFDVFQIVQHNILTELRSVPKWKFGCSFKSAPHNMKPVCKMLATRVHFAVSYFFKNNHKMWGEFYNERSPSKYWHGFHTFHQKERKHSWCLQDVTNNTHSPSLPWHHNHTRRKWGRRGGKEGREIFASTVRLFAILLVCHSPLTLAMSNFLSFEWRFIQFIQLNC